MPVKRIFKVNSEEWEADISETRVGAGAVAEGGPLPRANMMGVVFRSVAHPTKEYHRLVYDTDPDKVTDEALREAFEIAREREGL